MLVTGPPAAGGVTTSSKLTFSPAPSDAIVGHVTTLPDNVPPFVALTNVVPAGSVSVNTTFAAAPGPAFAKVSWYLKGSFACVVPTMTFVTEMSAVGGGSASVLSTARLFNGFGSVVVDVAAAMSLNDGPLGATTTSVKVCDVPVASVAIAGHVTTLPVNVPPPVALTNVAPAGSVSFTTTFAAADGPLFVTLRVYVTLVPVITLSGPCLVMATSATGSTVVVNGVRLFVRFGSRLVVVTAAMSVTGPPAAGGVTTSVKLTFSPTPSDAIAGQVTTLPANVPLPDALTNVTPAGSVSVSTTFVAA